MASPSLSYVLSAVLALGLVLAGCSQSDDSSDGDDGGPTGGGTGSASAYVKDAPSDDFREVHVVFTEVSVHRSGSASDNGTAGVGTATATTTNIGTTSVTASLSATATVSSTNSSTTASSGPGAGWIVLFSDAAGVDVDLLNTTGARAAFLGEEDLAAGNYQQIRIEVEEAWGITHDGERENITVSGGTLRSVRSFQVESGKETRITIDIDLDRSLRQQGNGEWRMTPVIGKTTAQVVDDGSSGEDTAEPGDVESVPESGSGTSVSGSVSVSGSASNTVTSTSTDTATSSTTTT